MATKKKIAVEGEEGGASQEQKSPVEAATRRGMVIELSQFTVDSITKAEEEFGDVGLKKGRARELVEQEIARLASTVSAVELYEAVIQAKFSARAAARQVDG